MANAYMLKELALASQSKSRGGILRAMEADAASVLPVHQEQNLEVTVPCQTIGLRKNREFCLRTEILDQLREELNHVEGDVRQRSLALWGLAGMGKSQIASSYAWRRSDEGVPAVFWVNSETALEIDQSFTKIALKMRVQGADRDGNDEINKNLVIKWLEKTCKLTALMPFLKSSLKPYCSTQLADSLRQRGRYGLGARLLARVRTWVNTFDIPARNSSHGDYWT